MKFVYQYRSKDNVMHDGVISAPDRESAFKALKAQGVRPCSMADAPGLLNKILGKGKRWSAIVVLVALLLTAFVGWFRTKGKAEDLADRSSWEERQQLYGDPNVIKRAGANDWEAVFDDVGDRHLAKHAIPGVACGCEIGASKKTFLAEMLQKGLAREIVIQDDDLAEIVLMKKMVNGMKRELREYVADGGRVSGYVDRLEIRQQAECGICDRYRRELLGKPDDFQLWEMRNRQLRAMGLPMVANPADGESKTTTERVP